MGRYELFVAVELVRVEALLPYFRGQVEEDARRWRAPS